MKESKNKKDLGINTHAKNLVEGTKRENIKSIRKLIKLGRYYPKQKGFK